VDAEQRADRPRVGLDDDVVAIGVGGFAQPVGGLAEPGELRRADHLAADQDAALGVLVELLAGQRAVAVGVAPDHRVDARRDLGAVYRAGPIGINLR
jgi:hypothetical protein